MIELFDKDRFIMDRKSSKGNQLKFKKDDYWYKTDYLGYEGLVEYTISKLLKYSSLNKDEYVEYELDQIQYNDSVFNACKSKDFTEDYNLITLERLFKDIYGTGLNQIIYSIENIDDRLKTLVEQVERVTGLKNFGIYMNKVLTIDAMSLNEDRHTHNLAVLMNDKGDFKLSPIFDNGAGLMSDLTIEYPLTIDVIQKANIVKSKTICDSFNTQLEVSEKLYGNNLFFNYGYKQIKDIVDVADNYSLEIKQRVIDLLLETKRRYNYLFKKYKNIQMW